MSDKPRFTVLGIRINLLAKRLNSNRSETYSRPNRDRAEIHLNSDFQITLEPIGNVFEIIRFVSIDKYRIYNADVFLRKERFY